MTNFITIEDVDGNNIYNLYSVIRHTRRHLSQTVDEITHKWEKILANAYQICYDDSELSFTLTFKGQDASILLHLVMDFIERTGGKGYEGIAFDIIRACKKDK